MICCFYTQTNKISVHKEFNTIDFFHTCFVGFSDWQLYGGDVKFLGKKQKNGKIIPNNNEKLGAGGGKTFEFSKDSMVRFQAENCWNLREKALAFSVKTGKRMIWSQKCMWNENKLDSKKKFHPIQKETRREENIQKLCKYFISSYNSIPCNFLWSRYFGEFRFFFLVFFIRFLLPRLNSLFDSKCAGWRTLVTEPSVFFPSVSVYWCDGVKHLVYFPLKLMGKCVTESFKCTSPISCISNIHFVISHFPLSCGYYYFMSFFSTAVPADGGRKLSIDRGEKKICK